MGLIIVGFNITEQTGDSQFTTDPDALNLTLGGGTNVDFVMGAFDGYSGVANVGVSPIDFDRQMYEAARKEIADKQTEIATDPIHVALYAHDFDGYGSSGSDIFSLYAVGTTSILGRGGSDDIRITGTSEDYLSGGADDDYLSAGGGNDILDGGLGLVAMVGGAGDDRYYTDAADDSVIEASHDGQLSEINSGQGGFGRVDRTSVSAMNHRVRVA